MSPAETLVMIEERTKARLTDAWMIGAMVRAAQGNKFPKSPEELWEKTPAQMTDESIVNLAKAMHAAEEAEKRAKKPRVMMREE